MARYEVIELYFGRPIKRYCGGSEKKAYETYERFADSGNPVEMVCIEQQASNSAMDNIIKGIKGLKAYGCDHRHYEFKIHGRFCDCGALMADPGD